MYSERGCETLRSSVSIRCSQKTDPRRNMVSVPQQIHNDRTVPMTSPSCSLTTISCRTRPRGNVDDSCTFNVVIGLLLISACILRTSSTEMGGFGAKWGNEWCDVYSQRTRFYFCGFTLYVCANFGENPYGNASARAWKCTRTDTRTEDRQCIAHYYRIQLMQQRRLTCMLRYECAMRGGGLKRPGVKCGSADVVTGNLRMLLRINICKLPCITSAKYSCLINDAKKPVHFFNPDIIHTTLCKMQQIYYIHNVVQMQLISYIHNVGRWRHSTHQKCYC